MRILRIFGVVAVVIVFFFSSALLAMSLFDAWDAALYRWRILSSIVAFMSGSLLAFRVVMAELRRFERRRLHPRDSRPNALPSTIEFGARFAWSYTSQEDDAGKSTAKKNAASGN